MNLTWSRSRDVEKAYIIRIKGNEISEKKARDCADSCAEVGMPYTYWDAYDGTGDCIIPAEHHNAIMECLKITDHFLTRSEVACALSHISLWARCVLIDQPIVIFEHDAICLKAFLRHDLHNSICYLGGLETSHNEGTESTPIPWFASDGPNFLFICRAHAYSIDPAVAKNMLGQVISRGISASADMLIRADIFNIHQNGLYAVDQPKEDVTTISNRSTTTDRSFKRNDSLEW